MQLVLQSTHESGNQSYFDTEDDDDPNVVRWIVLQVATIVMFLIMLYVNIALARYEVIVLTRDLSKIRSSGNSKIPSTPEHHVNAASTEKALPEQMHPQHPIKFKITKLKNKRQPNSKQNYGRLMRLCMLMASIFGTLRFIGELLEIALEKVDIEHCDALVKFKIVMTVFFVTSIYSVLWFRQRLCYDSQFMRHLTSRWTQLGSVLVGVLLGIVATTGLVLFLATRTYQSTSVGCDLKSSSIPSYIGWIVFAGSTIIMQVLLLVLFIYPVYKHRNSSRSSLGQTKSGRNLMEIIHRAMIISSVCVCSDVVAAAITVFVDTEYNIVPFLAYDFNLVLSFFCILLSFTTWRMRLCPFYFYDLKRNVAVHSLKPTDKLRELGTNSRRMSRDLEYKPSRVAPHYSLLGCARQRSKFYRHQTGV